MQFAFRSADGESLPQVCARQRLFIWKGGESTLAISKQHKNEMVSEYIDWINRSRALIVSEYLGLSVNQIDDLRAKVREAGGEFHIVKNTLGRVAFQETGLSKSEEVLKGSTAICFAFQDAPAIAKVMADFAKSSDFLKIKGGYLDKRAIGSEDVRALADLPPLPVMRAQLLGVLAAPASKLVRTLAEPARQMAAVLKAYADKDAASEPAAASA
jgi:large subunit ribosomal protein L10